MNAKLRSVEGRITSAVLQKKVMAVLDWWDRSSLFPPSYLGGLEATFLRPLNALDGLVAVCYTAPARARARVCVCVCSRLTFTACP